MEKLRQRLGSRTHRVIWCLMGVRMLILVIASLWIILQDRDLPVLLLWTFLALIFAAKIINNRWKVKR